MLITSKIKAPILEDNLLKRASLAEKFSRFRHYKITVLTSPAGHGKSLFIAKQLEQEKIPTAWVNLDAQDNMPRLFWIYVVSALQTINEKIAPKALSLLNTAQDTEITRVPGLLLEELKNYQRNWTCPPLLALVLDDFHTIKDEHLLTQINQFLDDLPRYLHVIILGRKQPKIHLGTRLSRNDLLHITQHDLQLGVEETRAIISKFSATNLSEREIKLLHEKTEGWLGGLQLLCSVLANKESKAETLMDIVSSDHLLSEYLISEVFNDDDPKFLDLLFNLACLPRFNREFLANLPGSHVDEALWKKLTEDSLLLSTFHEKKQWFRVHRLISHWLLEHHPAPANNRDIAQEAARSFFDQDWPMEALSLAVRYDAWEVAVDVIDKAALELFRQGRFAMASELVAKIPADIIQQQPKMALMQILVKRYYQGLNAAAIPLEQLQAHLQSLSTKSPSELQAAGIYSPAELADLNVQVSLLKADIARYTGDRKTAEILTREVSAHVELEHDFIGGWILTSIGADELLKGNLNVAYGYLLRAIEISKVNNDGLCVLTSICWLGPLLIMRGQLASALDFVEQWQQWIESKGLNYIALSSVLDRVRALVYREQHRLDEAKRCLKRMQWASDDLDSLNKIYDQWAQVAVSVSCRDPVASMKEVDKLEVIYLRYFNEWDFGIPDITCARGLINLQQGNPLPLVQWAQNLSPSQGDKNYPQFTYEQNIAVRVNIELGRDMSDTIAKMRMDAQEKGYVQREIYCWLLEAINALKHAKQTTALKLLHRAMEMASVYGFVQCFIDEAVTLAPLIEKTVPTPSISALYEKIATSLLPVEGTEKTTTQTENPLSVREQEVLRLIVDGKTNKEIADGLSISATTVKSHLRNIFGKLDVNRRTQAIAEARARKWL